jgi:hypothetical protein
MVAQTVPPFQNFFEEQVGDHLRSIVRYEHDEFEVMYLRDDVAAQYDDRELYDAIDQCRLDSLTPPVYEDAFSEDHQEMTCLVQCFEDTIDMNFIVEDGVGVIVGLDSEAMSDTHSLITEAYSTIASELK